MKGVMRFKKNKKLSSRCVGRYKVWRHIGIVAYELDLKNYLSLVHSVFHVSMLKNFIGDSVTNIPLKGLGVDERIFFEEGQV